MYKYKNKIFASKVKLFSNIFMLVLTPEYFGCLGYIASSGYPTRTHVPIPEKIQLLMYDVN